MTPEKDLDLDFDALLDQVDAQERESATGSPLLAPLSDDARAAGFGIPDGARQAIDRVVATQRTEEERNAAIQAATELLEVNKARMAKEKEEKFGPQAPAIAPENDAWGGEFMRSLGRSWAGQVPQMYGGFMRQSATSLDMRGGEESKALAKSLDEAGQAAKAQGEKTLRSIPAARVDDLRKIRFNSISDFARDINDFVQFGLGQALGTGSTMIAGYMVGGLPGLAATSVPMGVGEMRETLEEVGVTDPKLLEAYGWAGGAAVSALDALVPADVMTGSVKKGMAKYAITRIAKTAGRVGLKEAVTETMQEMVQIAGAASAAGIQVGEDRAGEEIYNMGKALFEKRWELANAGALGFIGGVGLGAPSAFRPDRDETPERERLIREAKARTGSPTATDAGPATEAIPEDTRALAASQEGPTPRLGPGEGQVRGARPADPVLDDAERFLSEIGRPEAVTEPDTAGAQPAAAPAQEAVAQPAPVPKMTDILSALPENEDGDPDLDLLNERIAATGKRSFRELTGDEKVALLQSFRAPAAQAAPAPRQEPIAAAPSVAPAQEPAPAQPSPEAIVDAIGAAARDLFGGAQPQQPDAAARPAAGQPDVAGPAIGEQRRIVTPDGSTEFDVVTEVVDLSRLRLAAGDMQPRDRSRQESEAGVLSRAANLDPARLMPGRVSDMGAPIVARDGTIISGNGRVMSIGEVYSNPAHAERAAAYRAAIGPAAANMERPVLIQRLVSDLPRSELVRIADLSNRTSVAGMSATERALRDARAAGPAIMQLYTGGSFTTPENREFFRAFVGNVVTDSERGQISRNGVLTKEGEDRLAGAVLAAAYGDPDFLSRMLESTDDNTRAITGAMRDAAGSFIKLKQAIAAGTASEKFDITPQLVETARTIADLRERGISPTMFLAQQDAFTQTDPIVEALLKAFYNDNLSRQLSRAKLTELLKRYAEEAEKHQGGGLIPDDTRPTDVIASTRARVVEPDVEQQSLFDRRPSPARPADEGAGAEAGRPSDGVSGQRVGEEGVSATDAAAQEAAPQGITEAERARFAAVLATKEKRSNWGAAAQVSPDQLQALIDEAVADGRLIMRKGQPVRTGKASTEPQPPVVVEAAEAAAVPMGRGAERRLESITNDRAYRYAARLMAATGKPDAIAAIMAEMRKEPQSAKGLTRAAADQIFNALRPGAARPSNRAKVFDELEAALGRAAEEGTFRDAPSSEPSLEPDWRNGPPQNGMGTADISAATGTDGQGVGAGGEAADGGVGLAGGVGLPAGDAAAMGAGGNRRVQAGEPGVGTEPAGRGSGGRGSDAGVDGVPAGSIPAEEVGQLAADRPEVDKYLAAQLRADETVPFVAADLENIKQSLPGILPVHYPDILKAEQRFAKPDGNGFLFTNGTGTGKTWLGAGIIKRFVKQGKSNILILAPSQGIIDAWIKEGGKIGLNISRLEDTTTAGEGVVATTYDNMRENDSLVHRQWDLLIADEAHKLSQNESGNPTDALRAFRGLTNHSPATKASMMLAPELRSIDMLETLAKEDVSYAAELKAAKSEYASKYEALREQFKAEGRTTKALFLSATPFAYRKSTDYAEGFLFSYPEDKGGYNNPGGQAEFLQTNFGYKIRYNRAEEPGPEVNVGVLEREFYERLKREGVLSGRRLEVDADYDRRFILVDDAVGAKIDQALNWLSTNGDRYAPLLDMFRESFNYLSQRRLLEAIKAKHVIPRIKKDLDMGRKVVVFHDYNQGTGFDPFAPPPNPNERPAQGYGQPTPPTMGELYFEFIRANAYVKKLNFSDLINPIQTLTEAFPGALVYNGTIPKKKRTKAIEDFQKDGSGKDLIIVQSDAGEAGISLHDTTGKHQRILYNLGLPTRPTRAIQQEGRIYRQGQVSNAVLRYMSTGTGWERIAFAQTIAERATTAENLALGDEARALRDSFIDAFNTADEIEQSPDEGTGGKARDRSMGGSVSPFERAKAFYFAEGKKSGRRDQREGKDYYATPEPIGFKMVEFADVENGERVLEPSAGHGAIARWFPEGAQRTLIEPSSSLSSRAALNAPGAKIITSRFEDHYIGNKYDAIVMNPPFGSGGKEAFDHVQKAVGHLREGGRVVAIVPTGPAADKRFDAFMASEDNSDIYLAGDITMPHVMFERAGTRVATRIIILEKHSRPENAPDSKRRDLSDATTINELFDRIEEMSFPKRKRGDQLKAATPSRPAATLVEPSTFTTSETTRNVLRAEELGAQAFVRGIKAPVHDKEFMALLSNGPIGTNGPLLDAWTRGWNESNRLTTPTAQDITGAAPAPSAPAVAAPAQTPTAQQPATPKPVAMRPPSVPGVRFNLGETVHSKTGADLFVASIAQFVPRQTYDKVLSIAKKNGGYYSTYKGRDAIPGFQFPDEGSRKAFLDEVLGGPIEAPVEATEQAAPDAPPIVEEESTPLEDIINPIDRNGTVEEQLAQIAELTAENKPILDAQLRELDAAIGTTSNANIKKPETIASKASRPSILATKPWHTVAHIRDTLRFQTKISTFDQIEKAAEFMLARGYRIVKIDTAKMIQPKEWGWRFAGFDLRAPNGQLIEWYIIFGDMYVAKKKGHLLFEKWRNASGEEIKARYDEYRADVVTSNELYLEAFENGLRNSGYDGLAGARADISSLSASLPSIAAKFSERSSAAGGVNSPRGIQGPSALSRNLSSPAGSITQQRPESLSSSTSGLSISDTSSIGEVGIADIVGNVANGRALSAVPPPADRFAIRTLATIEDPVMAGHVKAMVSASLDPSAFAAAVSGMASDRRLNAAERRQIADAYTGRPTKGDPLAAVREAFDERYRDARAALERGYSPEVAASNLNVRPDLDRAMVERRLNEMAERLPRGVSLIIRNALRIREGDQTVSLEGAAMPGSVANDLLGTSVGASRKVLAISLEYGPDTAMRTFTHEEVHILRSLGVIGEADWQVLERMTNQRPKKARALEILNRMLDSEKLSPELHAELSAKAGKLTYREIYRIDQRYGPYISEEALIVEEVIAHAAADWADGVRMGGPVERVMLKIREFIEAVQNALLGLGFRHANDVFESIWSGELVRKFEAAAEARAREVEVLETVRERMVEDGIVAMAVGPRRPIEEVWGTKFQTLMSEQYQIAVAGDDVATQYDILSAKYNNALSDPPEMREAMKAEIDRLRPIVEAQEAELRADLKRRFSPDGGSTPPMIMYAIAGESAATADRAALDRAEEMERSGSNREAIWKETGWWRGVDGRWRFEIDDSQAKFRNIGPATSTLDRELTHTGLFDAYPELGEIIIQRVSGSGGSFLPGGMFPSSIEVGKAASSRLSVVLHEAQHAVQDVERFATGGSPEGFTRSEVAQELLRSDAGLDPRKNEAVVRDSLYRRLAGEVEARAVQARMKLTPQQRKERAPWLDYDVAEDQQIVRLADGEHLSERSYSIEPPVMDMPAMRGQAMFAIRAYHGSPYDIDRFDMSKIGTGEGAQAFGWGLYFAESQSVAEWYRDRLGVPVVDGKKVDSRPDDSTAQYLMLANGDIEEALRMAEDRVSLLRERMREANGLINNMLGRDGVSKRREYSDLKPTEAAVARLREMKAAQAKVGPTAGRLYEVSIEAEQEDFLDWGKPLSQQSERVRTIIEPALKKAASDLGQGASHEKIAQFEAMGLKNIADRMRPKEIDPWSIDTATLARQYSDALREAGIPGIRYLDQGSRGAGEGTYNYVVFDDSLIQITAKDGVPISAEDRVEVIEGMKPTERAMFAIRSVDRAAAVLERAARMPSFRPGFSMRNLFDRQMRTPGFAASEPFDLDQMRVASRVVEEVPTKEIRSVQPTVSLAAVKAKLTDPTSDDGRPPSVFKVGDLYWTNDGNHRIAAAKAQGLDTIRAEVISLEPKVAAVAAARSADTATQRVGAGQDAAMGAGGAMFARRGPTPPQDTAEGETPGLNKVISDLKKTLGMVTSQGLWGFTVRQDNRSMRVRPPSNVRGQFDRETGNVSVRQSRDIKTLAHEGGHYLESLLGTDLGAIKQRHAEALTGDAAPMPAALSEGWARWFESYVLDPEAAERTAPGLAAEFEELLEAERPDILTGLDTVQSEYQRYIQSAPIGEVAAGLSSQYDGTTWRDLAADKALDNISGKLSAAYQGAIDGLHVAARGVAYLLKTADANGIRDADGRPISLKVGDNFYKRLRLFAGAYGRGRAWLEKGVSDLETGRITSPSLKAALERALGDGPFDLERYKNFNQYLVSIRAIAEYDKLDQKAETIRRYDDVLSRAATARPRLADRLQKDEAALGRREDAVRRSETLLRDRRRMLGTAETRLENVQERMQQVMDDIAEADEAFRLSRDIADPIATNAVTQQYQAMRARRQRSLQVIERDQQQALRAVEALAREVDELGVDVTARRAEIAQIRQRVQTTQGQIAYLDETVAQIRRERENASNRGASRPPTVEPRAVHERVIRELGSPEFQEAARMVHDFTFGLLQARRQAGFISDDLFNELAKRKDYYVPFWRDMSDIDGAGSMFPGSGVKKWSMFKKFDGSDRSILMPLEVLSEEAYVTAQQIAFNDVVRTMADLADRVGPGGARIAERLQREETLEANAATFDRIRQMAIDLGVDPADAHLLTQRAEMNFSDGDIRVIMSPENLGPTAKPQLPLWVNGERQMIRLPDREFGRAMFDAVNGLGKEMSDVLVKALALPAQALRIGVTSHPDFIFRNIWRDVWTAWKLTGALPFVTQARGFRLIGERGEVDGMSGEDFRRLYNEAGGVAGGMNVNAQVADQRRDVKSVLDTNIDKKAIAAGAALGGFTGLAATSSLGSMIGLVMGGPVGAGVGFQIGAAIGGTIGAAGVGYAARHGEVWRAVESVETATRLGVAAHAYRRAREHDPSLSEMEAMLEAAYVSRDMLDWNRRGSKMLAMTRLVTFLNAQIQGLDKQLRQMRGVGDRNESVLAKHLSIVLRHQSRDILSVEDERVLADAYNSYMRWAAITLMLVALYALVGDDDDYQDIKDQTKWTHSWFKSLGIWFRLPKPFELAAPANIGEIIWDKMRGYDQRMGERVVDSLYEVLAPPGLPQAMRLTGGLLFNRDRQGLTGRSREIVGENLMSRPPHERYHAFSSELAIDMARAIHVAHLKTKNWPIVGSPVSGILNMVTPAPVKIDFVLSAAGAYWGREVQNAYQTAKTVAGMSVRPDRKATDFPILRGFTGEAARQSQSVEEMYKMISRDGGEMIMAATEYKQLMDDRGRPAEAATWLASLDPEQRVWALTQYYGSRSEKREHPLERARQADAINREIMRDTITDTLAPKRREGRRQKRDFDEKIELTPAKKTEVLDILARLSQIEARNTMVLLKRPGFEGLTIKDPQAIIDELKASSQPVHDLLIERRDKKVADWPDVEKEWPRYRDRVLKEGVNAF